MTWDDVRIATLQKMFAITGDTLLQNSSTLPYIKSMPQVANEALQLLSTSGKYIIKDIEIIQTPVENLLGDMLSEYIHESDDVEYTATGAQSYYFELNNPSTVTIKVGTTVVSTITKTTKNSYEAYSGLIANTSAEDVTLTFSGAYPYNYRNVALYETTYQLASDVPYYTNEMKYDLSTLVSDFYKIKEISYKGETYKQAADHFNEGDSIFILDGTLAGQWIVYYYAYPQQITSATTGTTVISLAPEVAVLLPLYMASQLYKDDDIAIATQWRNEFEVAKELLNPTQEPGMPNFINTMGW